MDLDPWDFDEQRCLGGDILQCFCFHIPSPPMSAIELFERSNLVSLAQGLREQEQQEAEDIKFVPIKC